MIAPADWKSKRATLARYRTVKTGNGVQSTMTKLAEPEPINRASWEPSETMKGQLRLRREGAKLLYLINEDLGQPFREICRFDYGADNIDVVRLVVNPGNSHAALDARLLDVQMHWGGLPNHAATAPAIAVSTVRETPAEAHTSKALLLLALGFMILIIVGVAAFYVVRHRNNGRRL
jgi:hypothetical protein